MLRNRLRTNEKAFPLDLRTKYTRVEASGTYGLIFGRWSSREECVGLRVSPLPQDPGRLGGELVPGWAPAILFDGDHRRTAGVGGIGGGSLVAGAADLLRGTRLGRRVFACT